MSCYAGLGVSLEGTAICVVDAAGTIVKEMRAESAPDALHAALQRLDLPLARDGMEACSLTAWLHDGLAEVGWPALCIETRQAAQWGRGVPTAPHGGADHADGPAAVCWPRFVVGSAGLLAADGIARSTSRAGSRVAGGRCWSPGAAS